jgi:hypothetical protein
MDYKLIVTHYDGEEECFLLQAENIVDIRDALVIANKRPDVFGQEVQHHGECMPDTLKRMSKVPVPMFNY